MQARGSGGRRESYGQELRDIRADMNPIPSELKRASMQVKNEKKEKKQKKEEKQKEKRESDGTLAEGWRMKKDKQSGRVFYFNETTGKKSWKLPGREEKQKGENVEEVVL